MSKILDINCITPLQSVNRIAINQADSKVSKIMDNAQNVCFYQNDSAKQPVFNYNGYFEGTGNAYLSSMNNVELDFTNGCFMGFWLYLDSTITSYRYVLRGDQQSLHYILVAWDATVSPSYLRVSFRTPAGGITFNHYLYDTEFPLDEWFHFGIRQDSLGRKNLFVNGVTKLAEGGSSNFSISAILNIFGSPLGAGGVGVKNIEIHNKALFAYSDTLGTQVFTPKEPAIWYKKYLNKSGNKKLFLSSRYLKDAVISSASEITSINDDIQGRVFTYSTSKPKYSKYGIEFASGDDLVQPSSDDYAYGTDDFTLGLWVDFQSNSDVISIGSVIKIGIDATNIYAETSGGKLYATRSNAVSEGYKYVCLHRESGVIYLTINGVRENSRSESVNYSSNQTCTIGGSFVGYVDDLFNSKTNEITFVGTSAIDKVFQPDLRGSLNVKESTAQIQYIEDN